MVRFENILESETVQISIIDDNINKSDFDIALNGVFVVANDNYVILKVPISPSGK